MELAAAVVGDTEGQWRREALPQAVQRQLELQALRENPKGPLDGGGEPAQRRHIGLVAWPRTVVTLGRGGW